MDNKITIGILMTLGVLAGFGGNALLTQEQFDKAYVCNSTESWGVFERLSSTKVTAYPYLENNTGSKICSKGNWVTMKSYVEKKNLTVEAFVLKQQPQETQFIKSEQYVCDTKCCCIKE